MELGGPDDVRLDTLLPRDIARLDWVDTAMYRKSVAAELNRCINGAGEYLALRAPDGSVVAKAAIDFDLRPESGLILQVITHPAFRRQGLATRLLEVAEGRLAERGIERAELNVELRNTAARSLYEGLGYRETGRSMETVMALCARGTRKMTIDRPVAAMAKPIPPRGSASLPSTNL